MCPKAAPLSPNDASHRWHLKTKLISDASSLISGFGEPGCESPVPCREDMCFFKVSIEEKVLLGHEAHLNGLSGTVLLSFADCGGGTASGIGSARIALADPPCFLNRWRSQFDFVVKRRGQWGHLKGFCPVCVSTWRRSDEDQGNFLWQYGQETRFGARL